MAVNWERRPVGEEAPDYCIISLNHNPKDLNILSSNVLMNGVLGVYSRVKCQGFELNVRVLMFGECVNDGLGL